ncbi:MAG: peptidase [Alphaproteobacteria bacterium]|nr:peptidase [Alphaproteobacteria bacterium]
MENSIVQTITLTTQYALAALLLYAAIIDIKTYTIANWISIVIIALFPIILFLNQGLEFMTLLSHLGAGLAMLLFGAGLFATGAFGGGDAKLIAALAVWLGWKALMPFLLIMSVVGGLFTVIILTIRKLDLFKETKQEWLIKMRKKDRGVPYGVAISIAGIFYFLMNNGG